MQSIKMQSIKMDFFACNDCLILNEFTVKLHGQTQHRVSSSEGAWVTSLPL